MSRRARRSSIRLDDLEYNKDLGTSWYGATYDEAHQTMTILIPPDCCTDMDGAIRVATRHNAQCREIVVRAGGKVDIVYRRRGAAWDAHDGRHVWRDWDDSANSTEEVSVSVSNVVRFHQNGSIRSISTNAPTEESFLREVEAQLGMRVQSAGELETGWLKPIVDICCKLRGYKADVYEHRVLVAGEWLPEDVVNAIGQTSAIKDLA